MNNWDSVTLGDIAEIVTEKIAVSTLSLENYISTENMLPNRHGVLPSDKLPPASKVNRFNPGDILFSNIRTYFKKVWYARFTGGASADVIIYRPKDLSRINPLYLYYLISSDTFIDFTVKSSKGTKMPRGDKAAMKDFKFLLPTIEHQKGISEILSNYDRLISNCQRRIEILESISSALYYNWFTQFSFPGCEGVELHDSPIGQIPDGWELKRIGDLSAFIGRGISPKYADNGDSIVVNQKCIRNKRLSLVQARRQSKKVPTNKKLAYGDVLINSTGVGTLGRVAQVYEEYDCLTVDSHVTISRPSPEVDPLFYGSALLNIQEEFERLGKGATGQTELSKESVANILIAVPPIKIQKLFGDIVRSMKLATVNYEKKIDRLRLARDLLAPALVSGRLEFK